jgi:hypothetical protein
MPQWMRVGGWWAGAESVREERVESALDLSFGILRSHRTGLHWHCLWQRERQTEGDGVR